MGKTPTIAIADVDLAKEILVKEFDNFIDRELSVSMVNYISQCYNILLPAVSWVVATLLVGDMNLQSIGHRRI